jgi:uncharacterized protein YcfJ
MKLLRRISMKAIMLMTTLAAAIALAPAAQADNKNHRYRQGAFDDYAEVISVRPIMRIVEVSAPQRECWEEEVSRPVVYRDNHDAGGAMILGGIVGGIVGHNVVRGRGKNAATLAGTLIGASIAHDAARNSSRSVAYERTDRVQRCQIVQERYTEERIDGYDVTYRYDGELFTTRLPYDPGKRLRVKVSVAPALR